jgi:lipoprotein NlpD
MRPLAFACIVPAALLISGCANVWTWNPPGERQTYNQRDSRPRYSEPEAKEHVVVRGDTMYSIAFRHQLDYREVARWNGIGSDYLIYPGQKLRLTIPPDMPPPPPDPPELPPTDVAMQAAPVPIGTEPATVTPAVPAPRPVPIPIAPEARQVDPERPVILPPVNNPTDLPGAVVAGSSPPVAAAPLPPPAATPPPPTAPVPAPPTTVAMAPPASVSTPPPVPARPANNYGRWTLPTRGQVVRDYDPAKGSKGLDISGELGQAVVASAPGKVVYSGSALKGYGELVIIKHDDLRLSAYGYNRRRLVSEGDSVQAGQTIAELGTGPENRPLLHFEIRERGKPVDPARYFFSGVP